MCKTALELVAAASVWTSPNRGARAVQRTTKPLGRSQVNPGRVVRAGADSARPPELTWAIGVRIARFRSRPRRKTKDGAADSFAAHHSRAAIQRDARRSPSRESSKLEACPMIKVSNPSFTFATN